MSADRDDASRGRTAGDSVRLSPPPKVEPIGRGSGRGRPGSASRGPLFWLTVAVFLALGTLAFAVFVLLPDWVETTGSASTEASAAPTADLDTHVAGATGAGTSVAAPSKNDTPSEDSVEETPPTPGPVPKRQPELAPAGPVHDPAPPPPAVTREPQPAPNEDFARAMAEGLARLQEGELEEARVAFEEALGLSPGSPEASQGLARVESARQLVAIGDHRERATAFEEAERWGEAATEYAAVLALDPTIRFAQEGHERSSDRRTLSQRLEAHLARPDRLSSDSVLEEARELLGEARGVAGVGPELERQIDDLTEQISIASTPLPVVLVSDGLTEILVYRVGRLGVFERRQLDLRPGSYTVVGTRDGYRDVRRELRVQPGGQNALTVRCEEKI